METCWLCKKEIDEDLVTPFYSNIDEGHKLICSEQCYEENHFSKIKWEPIKEEPPKCKHHWNKNIGGKCHYRAVTSGGFCRIHDPELIKERDKGQK